MAILDYCHNCGKSNVHLNIVHISEDGDCDEGHNYHHIHVYAACDDCKRDIWDVPALEINKKEE